MMKLRKKQKGFTLVELLIVIAIIAVLAAVVTPVALSAINSSKATAIFAEMKSIETADLTYYVQTGDHAVAAEFKEFELNGMEISDVGVFTSPNAGYTITSTAADGTTPGYRTITATGVTGGVATELTKLLDKQIDGDYVFAQ